ncbi:MAG TPA: PHB depolymerase family esterase, partial [Amaricoccus sp.]|uniref:alpha/beta hydrolase family esterase n=1 Tax=Amaricoccus sp. TaxID=1872485 RepID=UPI002C9F7426
ALAQGRRVWPAPPAPVPPPEVPPGAAFLSRSFACVAGMRGYRLYVPAPGGGPLAGLVLMLHGCRQDPDDFATGTGMNALAEAHRLVVAYPAQTSAHNLHGCWNWFRPGDQHRGA